MYRYLENHEFYRCNSNALQARRRSVRRCGRMAQAYDLRPNDAALAAAAAPPVVEGFPSFEWSCPRHLEAAPQAKPKGWLRALLWRRPYTIPILIFTAVAAIDLGAAKISVRATASAPAAPSAPPPAVGRRLSTALRISSGIREGRHVLRRAKP